MNAKSAPRFSPAAYGRFLLFIAGMGGLLYGIDVGIVAAALLYRGKTISLSLAQTSAIVAAVFGGSMLSSLVAGFLADLAGRRRMMIFSGFLFVGSVVLIVFSQGFAMLFAGRLLQGMSGGVIAVVVPLYLAECLKADMRGRGSAIFQLMLTVGIVIASVAGWFYTQQAEAAIAAAKGNTALILAAQNHAWRGMFLSVIYPGLIFFIGSFFLSETPRWLFRKGHPEAAFAALERSCVPAEAALEFREMEAIHAAEKELKVSGGAGSLLQRKYVIPFLLACVVLGCNQATGINSILGYQVIILKQAGMTARNATQGDIGVKLLNCLMTIVAVALVDRKGRKFLLTLGTAGIIVALSGGALVFHTFESKRINVRYEVQARVQGDTLDLPASFLTSHAGPGAGPTAMTVLYNDGSGDRLATSLSSEAGGALRIHRSSASTPGAHQNTNAQPPLRIREAFYGPVPSERTGWLVALCLALFIASFSVGPGVVVWLALSELMPTRIRSGGMGIALLINQGVSTLIAGVFLPVVGTFGYQAMFLFWAGCTVIYFITAVFFLPETKGKTLEEIELHFEA
jgi:SP family myo-inositol transporter-like MFS transporter 13